jgi:hypothetical protein
MFTYTYERQDIIQIALKRLPGGGERRRKKGLSDLALLLLLRDKEYLRYLCYPFGSGIKREWYICINTDKLVVLLSHLSFAVRNQFAYLCVWA